MSLRLEHLIQPWGTLSHEAKLEVIRKVRYNRFTVKATMAKAAEEKKEAKKEAKRAAKPAKVVKSKPADKASVTALLKAMSPAEREAFLAKVMGAKQ